MQRKCLEMTILDKINNPLDIKKIKYKRTRTIS